MSIVSRMDQIMNRLAYFIIISVAALTGCKTAENNHAIPAGANESPVQFQVGSTESQEAVAIFQDAASKEYVFSSGDTIDVKFFYTPELNETLIIRPDGQISLQIIGDVMAAGKTPAQLRGLLKRLYTPHLKDPEISVIVKSFSNQRIYVGGQVMRPGTIAMSDQMTVLEAIIEAGGIDYRQAQLKNVVVIRYHQGRRYGYKLDMEAVLQGRETQPFFLEPKDIVYVPQTEIAKVNQWIDQHINKIIPQTGFVLTQRHGDTTIGVDTSSRY